MSPRTPCCFRERFFDCVRRRVRTRHANTEGQKPARSAQNDATAVSFNSPGARSLRRGRRDVKDALGITVVELLALGG